jgi:hypothetical protein
MGSATRYRQAFLRSHPICAFCGGKAAANTIEHCPPRAMFQYRHWPEGFEFPACESCNHSTDNEDLLVAMLARMDPFEEKGDQDGKLTGLMKAVNRQYPELFARMMPSAREARRQNRKLGIRPEPGQTHQEAGGVKVPEELHSAVCAVARKLAKGIFYREAKLIFPDAGCLLLNWFTNADLLRQKKYPIFDLLKHVAGEVPRLQRSQVLLNHQFEYKWSLSAERTVFVLQAIFGKAFGFVLFGSTLPDHLENRVRELRASSGRPGPFAILQSATLAG